MADEIEIEILEDGTISVMTEKISGANHVSADELLEMINDYAGGKVTRDPRKNKKARIKKHHHAHNRR